MENQHRKINGDRELDEFEISLINEIKKKGDEIGALIANLRIEGINERWVSIGATDIQTGLMALTRAVAKPNFF